MRIILEDNDSIHYEAEPIQENRVVRHVRFKKVDVTSMSKKKDMFNEMCIYFFLNDPQGNLIFWEGMYAGLNTNDRGEMHPSLVSGPIVLERIDSLSWLGQKRDLRDFNFQKKKNVSWIVACKVANQRREIVNDSIRNFNVNSYKKQKESEIKIFNDYNATFKNPNQMKGRYILLIYSPSNKGIRKLVLEIDDDFVVRAKAVKSKRPDLGTVQYVGAVTYRSNDLLRFVIHNEEDPKQHIYSVLEFKSANRMIFGVSSGVCQSYPKQSLIVLVKENGENSYIDFTAPAILDLYDSNFKKLDATYNFKITKLFSGEVEPFLSGDFYDKVSQLRLLSNERSGDFKKISGVYEQYYLDYQSNAFRCDFIQIHPNGKIKMIGKYSYEGEVKLLKDTISIYLKSDNKLLLPVQGLYNIKSENGNTFCIGAFCDITDQETMVIASRDVWFRISEVLESDEIFLKRTYMSISIGSTEWDNLNVLVKEKLIYGENNNRITSSMINQEASEIGYSFFRSACFLAQHEDKMDNIQVLRELKRAIKNGFKDTEAFEKEVESGVFKSLKKYIDPKKLMIDI